MKKYPPGSAASHAPHGPHGLHGQRGLSLLVVMVLILAIMLMTLTAFYISKNQYQLVGNLQASARAFSQAEAAGAAAQDWIQQPVNAQSDSFTSYNPATAGLYPPGQLSALGHDPATMRWSDANSTAAGDGRYLIELLQRDETRGCASLATGGQRQSQCQGVDLFRILAKASAGRSGARIIETIEAVPAITPQSAAGSF